MSKIYIDFFLASSEFYFYFDKEEAEKEAIRQKIKGHKTEIYKERDTYTVFIFKK